jgi:hypothetical protein
MSNQNHTNQTESKSHEIRMNTVWGARMNAAFEPGNRCLAVKELGEDEDFERPSGNRHAVSSRKMGNHVRAQITAARKHNFIRGGPGSSLCSPDLQQH